MTGMGTGEGITMNVRTLSIIVIAACLGACGDGSPDPQPSEGPEAPAPAAEADAAGAAPELDIAVDEAFIDHMHAHADQMDDLMFALADDDLDGTRTPAYWLSRHEMASGLPEELHEYVSGMREAAGAVEVATDLETARAAAEEIRVHCQGCHATAGVIAVE